MSFEDKLDVFFVTLQALSPFPTMLCLCPREGKAHHTGGIKGLWLPHRSTHKRSKGERGKAGICFQDFIQSIKPSLPFPLVAAALGSLSSGFCTAPSVPSGLEWSQRPSCL